MSTIAPPSLPRPALSARSLVCLGALLLLGGCGADGEHHGPPPPPAWFEPEPPLATAPEERDTWRFVPVEGALCANGQQSGYFANITDRSDDLLIFLLGGGICFNDVSCGLAEHRALIEEGLGPDPLAWWLGRGAHDNGIFARDAADNPFKDVSYIVLPHCTVDFHSANQVSNYTDFPPLHQVGYRNVQLVMNSVVPTFADPDRRVTIAGFSAGGVGTLANYHQIASAFESYGHAPPFMINDGGPIQRREYFSEKSHEAIRQGWGLDDTVGTWCETCAEEGYHETLRWSHQLHPGMRSAQVCGYADSVVTGLYLLFDIRNAQAFTSEERGDPPETYTSMKGGLVDLASWSETLPIEGGMHRAFYYYSARHGALTVAPLGDTPGLAGFLAAQLDGSGDWSSVIP
jgi:hypothetical protein